MNTDAATRRRVLIADDDPKMLALLEELLESAGYEVATASDGQRALEQVPRFEPDTIISDVVMPVMNGIELCKALKRNLGHATIPVVLVSGIRHSAEDILEGLTAGADDYLDLPFRNDELLVKVAQLTERHRVEKHYRELVEQAVDIMYTRTMSGFITSINPAGARFFGKTPDEVVGMHLGELVGYEPAARDIEHTNRHTSDVPIRSLHRLQNAGGNWRYLEGVITVQRNAQGTAVGVRGVVRDVTDQKTAEAALRESEDRYRRLVELSPEAIIVHTDGRFVFVNAAAVKLWGASRPEELIGELVFDFIHPEFHEIAKQRIAQVESDGIQNELSVQKFVKVNGEIIDVEVAGMPFTINGQRAVQTIIRDITDQKRAHDALKETEERLRTVIGSASLVLFAVDLNGIFTLSEGEGLKALGLTPGSLVGQSVFDVYRESPQILGNIRAALEGRAIADAVTVGRLVFDTRYSPLRNEQGKIVGVIGVATDITETRRAAQALQENEERYRELFENANDIIYSHDLEGNFMSLNRSGELITGYSREEALQMNVSDVIAPEYLALARQRTMEKAVGKSPTVYELEIITKHGRRVRLEVSTRLILRGGQPFAVQGIGRDLTERKRSEEALRESQAFFDSFMDNSPAVAFLKDEQGRYVYVNKPFEQLFGQKLEFLRGRTSFDWLPASTAARTHEHDLKVLATGVPQEIIETVPTQDGSPHQWLVFKFPTSDASGKRYVGGVGVDISGRRRAEEALAQQAEREAITRRISQTIRCSLDSAVIFRTAVHELGTYLNVDRCSLFMKDERAQRALNVAEYHVESVQPAASDFELKDLKDLINSLDQGGILVFSDAANDPRIKRTYEQILSKAGVRSIMYAAIRVGDEVPAAFALSTTRELREWSDSDIALVKAIADQTGIAIRQAQLYQKAEATSTREALVNKVTTAIRASLSLSQVLSSATSELGRALSASRVYLHLYNSEDPLSPVEHEYLAPACSSLRDLGHSNDDKISTHLLSNSKLLVIDDALKYQGRTAEFTHAVQQHAAEFGICSQIDYPLMVKGVFRGVISIHQTDRIRRWTEDEVALVEAVAERLVIGIAQAELFEMVARGKTEWETTFDAMSDGIFIFDRAGLLKRVNRAGAAMEDVAPHMLLGRKCCDILRASEEEQRCVVEGALESGSSITIEITPQRLNRPLLVTIEPVIDNGKVTDVVCTARDLSELRKVEAVAREHQSLLTNILESARESIYAVDSEGRFKWCNSATLRGLGYKREHFIGLHLLEMVYEGDCELVAQKLQLALEGQPQTYEMRYFSYDGRLRYARVDNSPLVIDGHPTGVLGIARDITEQKEERERAARADKLRALGQLASGVAHDFNNSLAAILGRAQLLRRQTNDAALVRNLDIIQTAAEDAAATVRRIQTFARKSPAREFEMLNIRSLLNDAIEITRTRWENEARLRGLDYEVRLEAEHGWYTYGSASELREVFVNLIVNAVDAMPKGGKLSIICEKEGGKLLLRFADNGTGMPEDVRQKVFDPFFTTKGAQGTGLGLSVSYSIIERHEGSISVASEPGGGTTFTIEIPATEAQEPTQQVSAPAKSAACLSVLVIDDEAAVRETLADMLTALGHQVALAASGQEALSQLAISSGFDVVFTDLAMPEMDGWETAREIRKHWPEISIVLVTGYGPGTAAPDGEESLVDGIIGKPFDFGQVSNTLGEVRHKRQRLEDAVA
ncbi:MAG TPA: PAS domain S-box protein [Pyrinomonadaceae bacterium]|nr:PAS domain S-box protein [Pyrinomonadaceae bacterium]